MKQNTKKPMFYFRLDADLAEKLDKRIRRLGYTSRTEFFTAAAYAVLYGFKAKEEDADGGTNLPESVKEWLAEQIPNQSEEEISRGLMQLIAENLTAAIAMKGVESAYENTWKDIREMYHEQTGIWVTESDLKEAYTAFSAVHKAQLTRYREEQLGEKL